MSRGNVVPLDSIPSPHSRLDLGVEVEVEVEVQSKSLGFHILEWLDEFASASRAQWSPHGAVHPGGR
jgi:hypothetical protein